jgi:TolC family type I secretion outer membrane protein
VFTAVVAAYANVIRDRRIVELSRTNLQSLSTTLDATRARYRARDLTRTDVDQSDARVALARGELESATARLQGSLEELRRLTGFASDNLAPLPEIENLPPTAEMAVAIARDENPQLISARSILEARRHEVRAARGQALPRVSAVVNGNYSDGQPLVTTQPESRFGATVGVSMNMSLFQGGRVPAQVRQASLRENQAELEVQGIERTLTARARSEFANWQAARAVVLASEQAVDASRQALSGVRAESDVGTRTILDILNAEQELRNAQVQLANAERDSYLAAFSLLMTMGRAQARNFGIGGSAAAELPTIREFSSPNGSAAAMGPDAPSQNLVPDADLAPVQLRPPMMAMPSSSASSAVSEPPLPASPAATAALRPAEVRVAKSAEEKWSPFPSTHWVVQLAAHESAAAARAHWDQLQAVIGGIIPDGAPMVALAPDAPKTVYRLAIGAFADFSQAETACSDLRVQGQSCIVRRVATLGAVQWIEQKSRKAGK